MNILGISCFYHDSCACLLKGGIIVAAAQEERFNRQKYSDAFPLNAINFCLQSAGMTIMDVDYIGFYEKPFLKFSRVLLNHLKGYPFTLKNFLETMPEWLQERLVIPLKLESDLSYKGKTLFVKHHLSHAASAFLASPFQESAILTVDGVGEWATASYGAGKGNSIEIYKEIEYPDSLGLLYSIVTTYLGFKVFEGEGKVMGLAGYGNPVYLDRFKDIILLQPDGSFYMDRKFFNFNRGFRMYNDRFISIFGPDRKPDENFSQRHYDIASSLQAFTEEVLLRMARHIHAETELDNLCLAGGVFLNCIANHKILKEGSFKKIFIQPATGDSGGAIGAALYIYNTLLNNKRDFIMRSAALGPEFSNQQIKRFLLNSGLTFREFNDSELAKYTAKKLAEDNIVGWFQGRMELGPRALGNRSILANPCNPSMKDILNNKVKKRESFRPYAPMVLEEKASYYFELDGPSPFMLLAPLVKEEKRNIIPAVTHVDFTARVQTINKDYDLKLWGLIKEFEKLTGVAVIVNTSFNLRGEPIVCTPEEAIEVFKRTQMDYLVLGNFVAEK
jgi:carbamoyltransferase